MKRSDPKTFGEIFNEAIAQAGLKSTYDEQKASYLWPEIVGPTVNRYTTRRYVERGVLHVCISSASLRSELQFLTDVLRDRINEKLGREVITSITIH